MSSKKELISDQRFSRITKDPRFWEMPEKDRKIKIDKRFQAMFHDKKFKLQYTVDKRGRPVHHTSTEDMKRFYDLSGSDSELSESDNKLTGKKTKKKKIKSKKELQLEKSPVDNSSVKGSKSMDGMCSSSTKLDISKNEGQESKSKKNKKETNANKSPQDKDLKLAEQSRQGKVLAENTVKEEDVYGSQINKLKTSENEESSEVPNLSEEIEDESESEDTGDLEEESSSGDDGEKSGDSEDEKYRSETDDEESDSGPDLARGKGNVETSSEDEEDDLSGLFPEEPNIVHDWGELAKEAPRTDTVTHRLAVCNMDWDRLKAKDLLTLLNSFTPKGGVVLTVKIYPSEYGKKRMKEEEISGPAELLSLPADVTEKDSIYKEKLRDYQFKRLKYFYAVVECDSPETASKIYEECDGLEFESSCSFVDLRFIPDDVTFDDVPKDVASEVDGAVYKPKYFTSAAVTTSKIDVTWDETDHERVTSLNKTFKKDELLDMDFQAYLASSSEEEEQEDTDAGESDKCKQHPKDDEEQIAKYRELLQSIQEKEKKHQETDMEMEIKWVPGLKESAEEMVRNKLEGKDKLTPWEQFLEKKREKKKLKKKQKAAAEETLSEDECPSDVDLDDPYFAEELRKSGLKKRSKKEDAKEKEADMEKNQAEMALLVMDEEEDERRHFNYDKIVEQQNLGKKKKKLLMKKKELLTDDFQVNVADSRFQAMYTSHLFNLDPSDPNFKKTKAVEKILEEKARRREQELTKETNRQENMAGEKTAGKKSIDPALSMLIKSVKNKTEQFQARKKQKIK